MMDDAELVRQLREKPYYILYQHQHERILAADRIEALIAERDAAIARTDQFKAALFWCSGSSDFNEGGIAREGWLKVCAFLLKGKSHE